MQKKIEERFLDLFYKDLDEITSYIINGFKNNERKINREEIERLY